MVSKPTIKMIATIHSIIFICSPNHQDEKITFTSYTNLNWYQTMTIVCLAESIRYIAAIRIMLNFF